MRIERLAAFGSAMHREARRLVDHQHQPVAVEQAGKHLFRCHAFRHPEVRAKRASKGDRILKNLAVHPSRPAFGGHLRMTDQSSVTFRYQSETAITEPPW